MFLPLFNMANIFINRSLPIDLRYLGIKTNENLNQKIHIHYLASELNRANAVWAKLRHFVNSEILRFTYFAIFHSHLNYVCIVWGLGIFPQQKVYILQKRHLELWSLHLLMLTTSFLNIYSLSYIQNIWLKRLKYFCLNILKNISLCRLHKHYAVKYIFRSFGKMKCNEMKYILFNKIYMNLQQFQLIPENKTQGDLINYLIFTIKKGDKDKESKIVKECLRQINL